MDFETTPINNIERAKAYFQTMGCSSFHMSREYPQRYDEYQELDIAKETEREWTYESFREYARDLRAATTKPNDLWRIHARMEELVQHLKAEDALVQIYEATEAIAERLPARSKVIVAETINGRGAIRYRTGLIFLAYALNRKGIAERFSEISLTLSIAAKRAGVDPERCTRAQDVCNEIRDILGFS